MAIRILAAGDQPIFRAGLRSLLEAQPGVEIVAEAISSGPPARPRYTQGRLRRQR